MEDLVFDIWESFSKRIDSITFPEFVHQIRTGKYKKEVEKVRVEFFYKGKTDFYKNYKKNISAITFSGKFGVSRSIEHLVQYYPLMILDIDNIENEEKLQTIFKKSKENKFVYSVFRSLTGNGLKIIVKTNNKDFKKHSEFYKNLVNYFESELKIELDKSTCDVPRLCFYSDDPDIYYNKESEIFIFETENNYERTNIDEDDNIFMLEMEEMIDFTEKRQKYEVGNRNNFIKLLSDNCSNHGINKSKVLEFCLNKFVEVDFDEYEIMITIENSYEKNSEYFGSWKNRLNKEVKKKLELKNKSKNKIKNTEIKSKDITFKDSVFQEYYDDLSKRFPEKYFNFISSLKSEREKDIVILSIMTVLNSIYQIE